MLRGTSVDVNDMTVLSDKRRLVVNIKEAATGGTVVLGGLTGNSSRQRIQKRIKNRHDVTPEAQVPAVAALPQSPDLAKFMSAFGSLKEKSVFGDDAVEFQRALREEWR